MGEGQVRDGLGTGEGQVRDQTGQDGTGSMPKGLLRLQKSLPVGGGWWVAEFNYSVCPRPFMRLREA